MFTSAGRAGQALTLTVIDERGREREAVGEAGGEEEEEGKSVKKAGYLPSLGEGESPLWWWAGEVRGREGGG